MEENRKKEIEARLFKLMSELEKPKTVKTSANKTAGAVRVIRRRKGHKDLPIS